MQFFLNDRKYRFIYKQNHNKCLMLLTYIYIYIYEMSSSYTFCEPLITIRSNGQKTLIVISLFFFLYKIEFYSNLI